MSDSKIQLDQLLELSRAPRRLTESDKELLPVYDGSDRFVGYAPRYLCHALGLTHKVALCYLIDASRRLLLQTRGDQRLDVAVAGHMSLGDKDTLALVCREAREETGLQLRSELLQHVATYKRVSPVRVEKPNERNVEIRDLFVYELSSTEIDKVGDAFGQREEKANVTNLGWFTEDAVLAACSMGNVADGLMDTIGWYLRWAGKRA